MLGSTVEGDRPDESCRLRMAAEKNHRHAIFGCLANARAGHDFGRVIAGQRDAPLHGRAGVIACNVVGC